MKDEKLWYMVRKYRELYASEIANQNPPANSEQSDRLHGLDGSCSQHTKGTCQDTASFEGDVKHSFS